MNAIFLAYKKSSLAEWPIYGLIIQPNYNNFSSQRLKLYYDHGEIKRYNGKRRVDDLKAFIDKFVVTSEVLEAPNYCAMFRNLKVECLKVALTY